MSTALKRIKLPPEYQDFIVKNLVRGYRVKLTGLGTFEINSIKKRKLFNNFSGKIITIARHNKVHFKPSLTIKKLI